MTSPHTPRFRDVAEAAAWARKILAASSPGPPQRSADALRPGTIMTKSMTRNAGREPTPWRKKHSPDPRRWWKPGRRRSKINLTNGSLR
jgi:hypothetical protein